MAELVKLTEIGRFKDDAKPGMVIRRIGSVSGGTPYGIVKGEDYRIEAIDGGAYKLTRLSDGYRLETYLHGNEHRYSFVEKAAEAVPVKSSETLREIRDTSRELTPGTIIRRVNEDTRFASRYIIAGYDYRVLENEKQGGKESRLRLECLTTGEEFSIVLGDSSTYYRIVEPEIMPSANLVQFLRIYRVLLTEGVDAAKAVEVSLDLIGHKT